ncbi:hypothetical protein IQ07DRAFT_638832 [Pyrenochaeta sp. DS3sAY3a]|nr:hypothetical protein IQ07DRAFT_638832 [Pyrenochaeta sp. DS3sAY3a]
MPACTINIKNKSYRDSEYSLFAEALNVNAEGGVFQPVYTTCTIPNSGQESFTIPNEYHVVFGTTREQVLGSGTTVETAGSTPVRVERGPTSPGTHIVVKGGQDRGMISLDRAAQRDDCSKSNAFQVDCVDFNPQSRFNQWIGLGQSNPGDESAIVPIAVFKPSNQTYFITPPSKYYITRGQFRPGEIFDPRTLSEPAQIDITGKTVVNVTHKVDGTWSVT